MNETTPFLTSAKIDSEVVDEVTSLMAVQPRVAFPDEPQIARIANSDVWIIRSLVALGIIAVAAFFWFILFGAERGAMWLFWPFVAFFAFGATLSLYEWFCYLGVRPVREPPKPTSGLSVDVLTTWCPGEPKDMVVATLKSIQKMRYPHTTYLCDEGNDPALREICACLGVIHVTREEKVGAKAGNINNALKQASGDIAVIMDPDHEAAPYFLDRVVGYFEDPKVGFVQHVQAYYNQDESLIALGAAEQTYHFYGPVQTGMHAHGTTQAIGANCAFRRTALNSIGGHAAGLAEDMATTLKLYAQGWKSVYTPQILSRGQVPSTYAAYCKQQLKWACGVWDILIESYPKAFATISWTNRLHYLMNGFFYLRGFVVLLGVLIPIAALMTGSVPIQITLTEFLVWFGPMFAALVVIKQVAQRWLLEPHEPGLHFAGGFLVASVWLIHVRGIISSVVRIKIPYIPTPKDDTAANSWSLVMPNILLIAASAGAIVYGLAWDWSPYAGMMAMFALINIVSLGTIALAAQQKLLQSLPSASKGLAFVLTPLRRTAIALFAGLSWSLRKFGVAIAVVVLAAVSHAHLPEARETQLEELRDQIDGTTATERGGFMLGAYYPHADIAAVGQLPPSDVLTRVENLERAMGQDMSIVSLYYVWNDQFDISAMTDTLAAIRDRGSVPMVTWMPFLEFFEKAQSDARYANEERVFDLILSHEFDSFIDAHARKLRDLDGPVLMRFAHEFDNPQYPWSTVGGNTPEKFKAAWRYIVQRFRNQGAENVLWVWSPWRAETLQGYHPGDYYVDYIGITLLNYGTSQGYGSWHSFSDLYKPFREKTRPYRSPVLLAEFGSTDLGGDRSVWLKDALQSISHHPEIKGAVFFNSDYDQNWPGSWGGARKKFPIEWSMDRVAADFMPDAGRFAENRPLMQRLPPLSKSAAKNVQPRRIAKVPNGWQLSIDGQPFQIRGIAYGAGQGWRSSSLPTRKRVEADFSAIAAMGANTVRIYNLGWFNRNVLNAAEDHGLKVMMGIWLDPDFDYIEDVEKMDDIEENVTANVKRWRDHPAVLGWSIGNETWGHLKHKYSGPLLVRQRAAYVAFVERLARKVKDLDQEHPVFSSEEFSDKTAGAIAEFAKHAPSVDAIGVNTYYREHLARLNAMIYAIDPDVPIFLSEFGPQGYWDDTETTWNRGKMPVEPSDAEKVTAYLYAWNLHVANRRDSIGGVAFSWSDRFEGSPTWFGLTDEVGRKKPAYYALANLWNETGLPATGLPGKLSIDVDGEIARGGRLVVRPRAAGWTERCKLEWQLVEEATLETLWRREGAECSGAASFQFSLPDQPGRFRLIARVIRSDSATVASHPIYIE